MRPISQLLSILFVLIVSSQVGSAQEVKYQSALWIKIDTDHANERYEWSANPMSVLLKDESGNVLAKQDYTLTEADCRPIENNYTLLLEFPIEASSATQIVLKASGADAILIDALGFFVTQTILTETENGWTAGLEKVIKKRVWGQDNAKIWCLSTDPNDVNGEWNDVTSACDASLTFDIGTGEIYIKPGVKSKTTDQIITTKGQ